MRALAAAAMVLAGGLAAPAVHAGETYPARPVRLVVPYAAGGFSDQVARVVGMALSKTLQQPVVIDNRGGANGIIGTGVVAKSPADGYTLLLALDSHVSNQLVRPVPYDAIKSFSPVALIGAAPMVLVANPKFAPANAAELVKAAKASPGAITYGSLGEGSEIELAARLLEKSAGIRMTAVPYKGGAPALTDLMGGQIQVMFASATSAAPYLRDRHLKPLGVASAKRLPMLPDVPTLAEQGYPAVQMGFWVGVMAPAGTPEAVVSRLGQGLSQAISQPDTAKRLEELGVQLTFKGPADFGKFLDAEFIRVAGLLRQENVTAPD